MNQKDWDIFETECHNFLKNTYQGIGASFKHFGGSDSTTADIRATAASGGSFFIEVKKAQAQCGQFVLSADDASRTFQYSPKNVTPMLPHTRLIMDYMNHHYEEYASCGTAGCFLPLDKALFYGWIESYYFQKGVRYFITKGSNYIIFPLEKFRRYFDVSATYRIKKSGSSDPSVKNRPELTALLSSIPGSYSLEQEGKHTFLITGTDLTDRKLTGLKYTYLFRYDSPGRYLIRRLSNTYNANVIFSISLKALQEPSDLAQFEAELR